MDDWSDNVERFASLLCQPRLRPPPDNSKTSKTQEPSEYNMSIYGAHFHEFVKLSIKNLKISNYHTLDWATNLLN